MTDAHGGRNPGAPFDPGWVAAARADEAAATRAEARARGAASALPANTRRARLLAAIACLDLTTLAGDDSRRRVAELCARARAPLPETLLARLGLTAGGARVAAVCVYPALVGPARTALAGSGIPVAAVAGGFPAGQLPLELKLGEIRWVVAAGAAEVDAVIARAPVLDDGWAALYHEVRAFKTAAGAARLKVILATGELGDLTRVARASRTCLLAGADFLKTSTGKEAVNATLPVGATMLAAIRDYATSYGYEAGFKPAGGICATADALAWQALVVAALGAGALAPARFRIGASGLLAELARELGGGLG
jgi:deoxyribose-phosphate aldolase